MSSRRRVLIVEDNPDGRLSLKLLLEAFGCEVQVACDGREGVEMALNWRPDAALVDVGLPQLDGFEVARRVRAALHDRIRLVCVTAYSRAEDRKRSMEAGFDDYLIKPADPDRLRLLLAGAADGDG